MGPKRWLWVIALGLGVPAAGQAAVVLEALRVQGQVPWFVQLLLRPDAGEPIASVESIDWIEARAGAPERVLATTMGWHPLLAERIDEPGTITYQARLVYAGSKEVLSNAVRIETSAQTTLRVSGFAETVVGNPVTYRAWKVAGRVEALWRVFAPGAVAPAATDYGETIRIVADKSGIWRVDAALAQTPAGRWTGKRLKVFEPMIRKLAIRAIPAIAQPGQRQRLAADIVYSAAPGSRIEYQWTLPSGRVANTPVVDHTVGRGPETIELVARVSGSAVERRASLRIEPDVYARPEWTLQVHGDGLVAPADVSISALSKRGDFARRWAKALDYRVAVDGGDVVDAYRNHATLRFEEPGEKKVTVVVSDDLGNRSRLERRITVGRGDALSGRMAIDTGDSWDRAPAFLSLGLVAEGLMPGEHEERHRILVDGEQRYAGPPGRIPDIEVVEPGRHAITGEITTSFGRSVVVEKSLELFATGSPDCAIQVYGDGVARLEAAIACETEKGALVDVDWEYTLNGEPERWIRIAGAGWKVRFTQATLRKGLHAVRATIRDDSGTGTVVRWRMPKRTGGKTETRR